MKISLSERRLLAQAIEHTNFKTTMNEFIEQTLGGKPQECVLPPGFHPMIEVDIIQLMVIIGGPWLKVAQEYIDRVEEQKKAKVVERAD